MTKGRPKKTKQRYFRKDYAPARAAALRSSKTSTRLKAQVSQQITKVGKRISSRSQKISRTARSKKATARISRSPAKSTAKIIFPTFKSPSKKSQKREPFTWREITMLSSIGVCAFAIAFTFIYANIFDPVKRSENELKKLANAYYIEYYYPRILGKYLYQPEKILADYTAAGLPTVYLRQLLLSNDGKYADSSEAFSNDYYQCNTNSTFVRYYPVAPYGPRDYTVTYHSDCEKPKAN